MKKNIFKIFGAAALSLVLTTSCDPTEEGPSVEDEFGPFMKPIPTVKATYDIPVGCFYYDLGSGGLTAEKYARLTAAYDQSVTPYPQLGSHVRPVLGNYKMDLNSAETVDLFQQHIDWANEAGIDFFILPRIRYAENSNGTYLNTNDVKFANFMEGLIDPALDKIKWGNLKFVIQVDLGDFKSGLSADVKIEDVDLNDEGKSKRCEQIYTLFSALAERFFVTDELYYKVDGKPMVVIQNPHQLYSRDSHTFYQNIRDTVLKRTGVEMFLVARQERWTPPARYHNFFQGNVDAVFMDNMFQDAGSNSQSRRYILPQLINENYKYNREYDIANYGTDFIPSICPSVNMWINGNGTNNYQYPLILKDVDEGGAFFRTMCNVAKLNLGKHPMVFIDSFNRWETDMAIEPSVPTFGNGYGMMYLNIVREEFKVSK